MPSKALACMEALRKLRQHREVDDTFSFSSEGVARFSRKSVRRSIRTAALAAQRSKWATASKKLMGCGGDDWERGLEMVQEGPGDGDAACGPLFSHVELKLSPDCLHPTANDAQRGQTGVDLCFYTLHASTAAGCAADTVAKGETLAALGLLGLAYLRPPPPAVLSEAFPLIFRGMNVNVTLVEAGCRHVSPPELALLQTFHLAVHAWSIADSAALPLDSRDWTAASAGAYYIVFPTHAPSADQGAVSGRPLSLACPASSSLPPAASSPSVGVLDEAYWRSVLPACIAGAQTLVRNLAQYRRDNYANPNPNPNRRDNYGGPDTPEALLLKQHYDGEDVLPSVLPTGDSTAGQVFARGSFDLWVGLSDMSEEAASGVSGEACSGSRANSAAPAGTFKAKYVSSKLSMVNLVRPPDAEEAAAKEWTAYLPRDRVRWMGQACWLHAGLVAPSVVWRLHSLCLAAEAHDHICASLLQAPSPAPSTLPPLRPMLLLEALTLARCGEALSLERLEVLGDAVLKFITSVELFKALPESHEGHLTGQRQELVTNLCLTEQARALGLQQYLRPVPLGSRGYLGTAFRPPGLPPLLEGGGAGLSESDPLDPSGPVCLWNRKLTASKRLLLSKPQAVGGAGQLEHVSDHPTNLPPESYTPPITPEDDPASPSLNPNPNPSLDPASPGPPGGVDLSELLVKLEIDRTADGVEGVEVRVPVGVVVVKLKDKCLADAVEAVVGAYYVSGGLVRAESIKQMTANVCPFILIIFPPDIIYLLARQEAALTLMRGLGMLTHAPPDACESGGSAAWDLPVELVIEAVPDSPSLLIPRGYPDFLRRLAQHAAAANTTTAAAAAAPAAAPTAAGVGTPATNPPLQSGAETALRLSPSLGYHFSDPVHLDSALTHCSVQHKPSNQRLEWLGDAVLDVVVVDKLYWLHGAADEGGISELKARAVCNARLAQCSVRLGLHSLLQYRTPIQLEKDFAAIDKGLAAGQSVAQVTAACSKKCEKVLADVFEAVIGAVYLDSNARLGLQAVRDVVEHVDLLGSA